MSAAKTVLIVEDDAAFAEFLRAGIESVGHRAVTCTNGAAALEAFDASRPDLVLLDILLPQRDGFQLCCDIRQHPAGGAVPIVLMTGVYKKASYERDALRKHGATAYIHKPFGVQELWSILHAHLGTVCGDAVPDGEGEEARLEDTPLVALLDEHHRRESNGVLFVRSDEVTHVVYLRWGEPIFIRSNDAADRLTVVLVKSGQVTKEQVDQALDLVRSSRGRVRLGQALVELNHLTEEQFRLALQLQLQLIFRKAFRLVHGTCTFVKGDHPTEEDVLLDMAPRALLMLGARETGSTPAVEALLPSRDAPLVRTAECSERTAELGLRSSEKALLELADGTTTCERFRAIAQSCGEDAARLLLGYVLAGLVAPVANPTGRPQSRDEDGATEWEAAAFEGLPVGAALADLHRLRATGTLEVRAGARGPAKRITFRSGSVVGVASDLEEDRLADMLVRLQLVGEHVLHRMLDELGDDASDAELARTLVAGSHVTPLQAYWAAVYQAQNAVHGLLALARARLTWTPGRGRGEGSPLPDVPTAEIVWNAVRSLPGPALRRLLPSKDTWLGALPGFRSRRGEVPLDDDAAALLEALSEPMRLGDVVRAGKPSPDEVRRQVHALVSCRLVGEVQAPVSAAEDDHPVAREAEMVLPLEGLQADPAPTAEAVPTPAPVIEPEPAADAADAGLSEGLLDDIGDSFLDLLHEDGFEPSSGDRDARASAQRPRDGEPSPTAPPGSPITWPAEMHQRFAELVGELRLLRPELRAQRRAVSGTAPRVAVDRAGLSDLLDGLAAVVAELCAMHAQAEELAQEEPRVASRAGAER